jgi:hypothetical protein
MKQEATEKEDVLCSSMYFSLNITRAAVSKKIQRNGRAEHRQEMRNTNKIVVEKVNRKGPLERPKRR